MNRVRETALLGAFLLLLLAFPSGMASGAGIQTGTITTTSVQTSACESCISTTITQIVPYSVKQGQFAADLGPITYSTSLQGFTWNITDSQSLTFGLPSLASAILHNSTLTSIQLPGISFFYKPEGYQTLIKIQGTGTGMQVCIPVIGTGGQIQANNTQKVANLGGNELTWGDIPASMNPSYGPSGLCFTPPLGPYSIDPLAIDGSGKCNNNSGPCTVTLTTSSSPDVIIGWETTSSGSAGGCSDFSAPTDTAGLTWTSRKCIYNGQFVEGAEYYAIASGTLSSDVVTCNNNGIRLSCNVFGISGANTASPYDSNAAVPCTGSTTSPSTNANCAITTSNANDILLLLSGNQATPASAPTCAGYNVIQGSNDGLGSASSCYLVVSSTQSLTLTITLANAENWVFIGDAIKQASATTVTQTITITTSPGGATSATITISGSCGYSNSTFTADGNMHTYTGITATCSTGLANPTPGTHSRYCWSVSPKPTFCSTGTITFTTAASGTGSYSNTTYYQLAQNYTLTPQTPSTWDGIYTTGIIGTFFGSGSTSLNCGPTASGGGAVSCNNIYFDYDLQTCAQTPIGNTWAAQSPSCFTDTTANHIHNVNYIQSGGGNNGLLIIGMIFGAGGMGLITLRRKRAGENDL